MAQCSREFGQLYSAACSYIALSKGKNKTDFYEDIGEEIGRVGKTTERFGNGIIPSDDQLMKISIFFHKEAPLLCNRDWMDDFLTKAKCSIKENILNSIFPPSQTVNPLTPVANNLQTPNFLRYVLRKTLDLDILSALDSCSVVFLSSFGGNGKSSCAYHIARKYVDKEVIANIDTVIWVCDKGNPGHTTLDIIYTELVKTLGVENASQLSSSEIEQLVQNLLNKHNVLFVIDNYETITDKNIPQFINKRMPANCKAIITCRHKSHNYPELENCEPIEVGGMNKDEIKELIGNRINRSWNVLTSYINEGFWDQLMEITGGNPFAAQTICGGLANTIRNGGDFNTALNDYSNYKSEILAGIFETLLEKQWIALSSDAKQIMILSSFFPKSVSNTSIKKILNWTDVRIEKAIGQCISLNLLDLLLINDGSELYRRYSQHPLVYSFIKHVGETQDISSLRTEWIKYYLNLTGNIGFAYNHVTDFSIFDVEGELEALYLVLSFCEKQGKLREFIDISENTKYYFYIRGLWKKGGDSIHIKRANAARKLGDKQAEFDALVYQINIASKRKEADEVLLFLGTTEEIMCQNTLTEESIVKFNHAKALYLSSIGNDKEAITFWNENLTQHHEVMGDHDYNANIRWKARSLLRLGDEAQKDEAIGLLNEASENAERENFLRGYLDANLTLADHYLQVEDVSSAEEIVDKIESRISEPRDNKYIAELYVIKAKIAQSKSDQNGAKTNLKLAIKHLEKSLHYNRVQELTNEFDAAFFNSC